MLKTGDFLRFLICARDPLRRFVWSRLKNRGLFTISDVRARDSAEIGVFDVNKTGDFFTILDLRARLCGDRRGRCEQNWGLLYDS